MQQTQKRNDQQVGLLSSDLQYRYESTFAWKTAIGALLALPALRGAWPMSCIGYSTTDRARDISGNGNHLDDNDTVTFGYRNTLIPVAEFVAASTQHLSRADGGAGNWADIIGTEAYIISTERGLTLGGWFYVDSNTAAPEIFIGKFSGVPPNEAYKLYWDNASTVPVFEIASGAANFQIAGTAGTTGLQAIDTWYFVCGRFTPSTEIKVWLNQNSNTNLVAIPASINDTVDPLTIGAGGGLAFYLDGKASLCFLSACAISDAEVLSFYEHTRPLFGV